MALSLRRAVWSLTVAVLVLSVAGAIVWFATSGGDGVGSAVPVIEIGLDEAAPAHSGGGGTGGNSPAGNGTTPMTLHSGGSTASSGHTSASDGQGTTPITPADLSVTTSPSVQGEGSDSASATVVTTRLRIQAGHDGREGDAEGGEARQGSGAGRGGAQ